jgi:cytochrome c peroxidase
MPLLSLLLACATPDTDTGDPEGPGASSDSFTASELTPHPEHDSAAAAFTPLTPVDLPPGTVGQGERLFRAPRLSADGTVACESCHQLDACGTDGERVSDGVAGVEGSINAPTVFNSALNAVQFWNGRAATLEEQVDGPLTNPVEMATDWPTVLDTLQADRAYVIAFDDAFGRPPDEAGVRSAIATFERSLVTTDAPFDDYLRGDRPSLSPQARAGYERFVALGCGDCHDGPGLGGRQLRAFDGGYYADQGHNDAADQGRFVVTHDPADRHVFKVPTLRNVACSAPYFHDGSAPSLPFAVRAMARYGLDRELSDVETADLVAFLQSLTGRWRGRTLTPSKLPLR